METRDVLNFTLSALAVFVQEKNAGDGFRKLVQLLRKECQAPASDQSLSVLFSRIATDADVTIDPEVIEVIDSLAKDFSRKNFGARTVPRDVLLYFLHILVVFGNDGKFREIQEALNQQPSDVSFSNTTYTEIIQKPRRKEPKKKQKKATFPVREAEDLWYISTLFVDAWLYKTSRLKLTADKCKLVRTDELKELFQRLHKSFLKHSDSWLRALDSPDGVSFSGLLSTFEQLEALFVDEGDRITLLARLVESRGILRQSDIESLIRLSSAPPLDEKRSGHKGVRVPRELLEVVVGIAISLFNDKGQKIRGLELLSDYLATHSIVVPTVAHSDYQHWVFRQHADNGWPEELKPFRAILWKTALSVLKDDEQTTGKPEPAQLEESTDCCGGLLRFCCPRTDA